MTLSTPVLPSQVFDISISRLGRYEKCERFFYLDTILKEPYNKVKERHFILGQWVHSLIENKLLNVFPDYDNIIETWLKELDLLDVLTVSEVRFIAEKLGELYWRASSRAPANVAIRTAKDEVPKDIYEYPPKIVKELIIPFKSKISDIDQRAGNIDPFFLENSFSWLIGEAFGMGYYFKVPSYITKTVGVETSLYSLDKEILLQSFFSDTINKYRLLGFIDWIVEIENSDGIIELAIIDHKTGKSCPSSPEVLHNFQLNLYAWAYHKMTGVMPSLIGIHHVRSGKYVIARVSESINQEIIKTIIETSEVAYTSSIYPRKKPADYQSPCLEKDWKTNKPKNVCPYLGKCWPSLNQLLEFV